MFKELRPAILAFIALTVITGAAYPMLVTGFAQSCSRTQANGSLIEARRQGGRLEPDRPAVQRSEILLEPAVGDLAPAL